MLRGSSGFYTYAVYEHLGEWPAFNIGNTRTVLKPRKDKYVSAASELFQKGSFPKHFLKSQKYLE